MHKPTHRVHWGPSRDFHQLADIWGNIYDISHRCDKFVESPPNSGHAEMEYCPYDKIWFEYRVPASVNRRSYLIEQVVFKAGRLDVGQPQG